MPQMDLTWMPSQLFWLFVCFALLYVIVSRTIVPGVERVLQNRSTTLSADLVSADAMSREAEQARTHYEKAQADARREADATIAKVQADAAASLAAEQGKLDAKLKAQMAEVDASIAAKLAKAEKEIGPAAASLAADITGKLLGKNLDASTIDKHIANAKA